MVLGLSKLTHKCVKPKSNVFFLFSCLLYYSISTCLIKIHGLDPLRWFYNPLESYSPHVEKETQFWGEKKARLDWEPKHKLLTREEMHVTAEGCWRLSGGLIPGLGICSLTSWNSRLGDYVWLSWVRSQISFVSCYAFSPVPLINSCHLAEPVKS